MFWSFVGLPEAALLVAALSLDAFVASMAFGAEKIKVPISSAVVIVLVCTGILGMSLLLGNTAAGWISPNIAGILSFFTLTALGLVRLFDSVLKRIISRVCAKSEGIMFRFHNVRFFLQVCADCVQADSNQSKSLSPLEAVSLAVALSLDGMAAGFGAGLSEVALTQSVVFSLVFNLIAVLGGCALGERLSRRIKSDLGWVSGLVLLVLGVCKLIY